MLEQWRFFSHPHVVVHTATSWPHQNAGLDPSQKCHKKKLDISQEIFSQRIPASEHKITSKK